MPTSKSIARAQDFLRQASYAIALTGAGISTPSGIPDFRSPGSGIWEHVDPMQIASLAAFRREPRHFYDWIRPAVQRIRQTSPNAAHTALAEMQERGQLQVILTQNIDGLHHRAGSRRVIELHGHFRTSTCIRCYRETSGEDLLAQLVSGTEIPSCPTCGGVLKPNVILFGEQLPFAEVQAALTETRRCDLMLIAGSSLTVEPAASLPSLAREHGAHLIIINFQPTHLDQVADVVIHDDVAKIIPMISTGL